MVHLGRCVRFSINPFLDEDAPGFNTYASRPPGEGLAVFLELAVELVGPVDPATGFLVNVTDIDKAVQVTTVPVFARRLREYYRAGRHVSLGGLADMLHAAQERLAEVFPSAAVSRLSLALNPFRKIAMNATDSGTIYFSEKFEFAAMHKLWNDSFSEAENLERFGKCANPTGHGHNYIVEVTIESPADGPGVKIGEFERVVDAELIQVVDHKNLNLDVPAFGEKNPTVENLAVFAWDRLVGKFDPARLHGITVWESDRTYCTYHGPQDGRLEPTD